MELPLVSVIMATYRERESDLRQAIESILQQTYKNFELVIVLDDPQNIKNQKIIEAYAESDSRIKFLINERNLGAHETRNRAIQNSYGDYIAIMDADDVSAPKRLELQINLLLEKEIDVLSGFVDVIDEEGKLIYSMNNLPVHTEDINKKIRINNCMPHPAMIFRRKVYEELHGYNKVPYGCEDYDFLLRTMLNGFKLYNVPDIVLKYRMTKSSLSRNNTFKQYLMMKYCQKKYLKVQEVGTYEEFLNVHFTEKKAEKFSKASHYFTQCSQELTNKKYVVAMWQAFKAFIISADYREKMFRYVLQLDFKTFLRRKNG